MFDVQWLIGGEAGYGIMTIGAMMAKIFTRLGLSVFDYTEYPSLIRGGHNAYYVRASDSEIFSQKKPINILVALNRETVDKHKIELANNAAVLYDPNTTEVKTEEFLTPVLLWPIPFLELTEQIGASKVMINTVAIGASLALFYSDFQVLNDLLQEAFGKKGEKIIAENINSAKAGFDFVLKNFPDRFSTKIEKKEQENLLVSGAEAVSLGVIKAGLKFAAIYPMTPINAVLTTLAQNALNYNIVVKEPEDEISGINMAIGAGYAGVRSMVATSGGGFSLMTEALGMSGQTEIPLVIIEGMRPGPSSGMPTWTEQGDLRFVLHASQGDFPKIVVAPGDPMAAFTMTMQAFNLAEKYQLPVIILVDKYLMESHATVQNSKFKIQIDGYKIERGKILSEEQLMGMADYKRYQFTEDGVSPRSLPGQKDGISLTDSYEHNENGHYDESSENRIKMMDKRFKKMEVLLSEIPQPQLFGEENADLTILAFGSSKMPILEAIKWLKNEGININFLEIAYLYPFPAQSVAAIIKNAKKTLVVEGNKTGQFEGLIKEQTGLSVNHHLRKYDGRPFYPEEIIEKVKMIVR